mmetsp:Transcript_21196/g.59005  ORF Transcript_21196/g.59005 Transcript_21196/m.59005 type:complete len:96 (+) Transcript_21196:844-1131(+)
MQQQKQPLEPCLSILRTRYITNASHTMMQVRPRSKRTSESPTRRSTGKQADKHTNETMNEQKHKHIRVRRVGGECTGKRKECVVHVCREIVHPHQ